jgi:predicted DNA-binding transcriptional regulator AlpA
MEAIQISETVMGAPMRRANPRIKFRDDIRVVFAELSDDVLLDDHQVAMLAGRSTPTIKRWRRDGKTPPTVMLNGLPRYRAGDIRAWLRGGAAAVAAA